MPNTLFKDFNLAMGRAIPLIIQKNRLEYQREQDDREYAAREAELIQEAEKAETDMAVKMYNAAVKDRWQEGAQAAGPKVERGTGLTLPKKQLAGPVQPGGDDLTRYLVPEKEAKEPKEKKLPTTYEGAAIWYAEKGDAVNAAKYEKLAEKDKRSGTAPRAVKAYVTPKGEIEYLPNNVKPKKGWTPYTTEEKFLKQQELISVREQERSLRREVESIKRLPNLDFYATQKSSLPALQDELEELKEIKKRLLQPRSEKAKDPLGIR